MHDGAILVLAGAGTGKTRTLTSAVAWRIARHGIPANRVLAVTFTNKAAREMTDRIRGMLTGQAAPTGPGHSTAWPLGSSASSPKWPAYAPGSRSSMRTTASA